jgi:hypothetical protein
MTAVQYHCLVVEKIIALALLILAAGIGIVGNWIKPPSTLTKKSIILMFAGLLSVAAGVTYISGGEDDEGNENRGKLLAPPASPAADSVGSPLPSPPATRTEDLDPATSATGGASRPPFADPVYLYDLEPIDGGPWVGWGGDSRVINGKPYAKSIAFRPLSCEDTPGATYEIPQGVTRLVATIGLDTDKVKSATVQIYGDEELLTDDPIVVSSRKGYRLDISLDGRSRLKITTYSERFCGEVIFGSAKLSP